jgi:putative inorganic carbon (HCO3(-)) transporter
VANTKGRTRPSSIAREIERTSEAYSSAQRVIVAATCSAAVLLFWRSTGAPFSSPKLTALLVGAVLAAAALVMQWVRVRRVTVPTGLAPLCAGLFALALVVTTVANGVGARTLLGPYPRYVGAGTYLACAVLFLATVLALHGRDARSVLLWGTGLLGIMCAYGVLQHFDADPFTWSDPGRSFSTMGQENFAAGLAATLFPLALGLALLDRRPWARAVTGVVLVLAVLELRWAASFQGPFAALVGATPVLLAAAWDRWGRRAGRTLPRWWPAAAGAALLAAAIVIVPLAHGSVSSGTEERKYLWRTALTIFRAHPLVGGGFGRFALDFQRIRPAEHAANFHLLTSDAAHSVPLDILASGGALLALAYGAFVLATGWCLVRGLRRTQGSEQVLLAALGGSWLAYQAQSLVSLDVPPLALAHWILAAGVIAASGELRITALGTARRPGSLLPQAAVAALALPLVWVALLPVRADAASARATEARAKGNAYAAMNAATDATQLASWEASYWSQLAGAYAAAGRPLDSYRAGVRATRAAPGDPVVAMATAGAAQQLGDQRNAERWFREAVRRDPHDPVPARTAGLYFLRIGDYQRSYAYMKRAVADAPGQLDFSIDLGRAALAAGRKEEAIELFRDALRREPGRKDVVEYLDKALHPKAPKPASSP